MKSASSHYNRIIFVLSLVGIIMAVYVLQSFLRDSSIVCISTGCETVRKSPLAYLFGIPVPAFGLIGYSLLALLSFLRTTTKNSYLINAMLCIAAGGVAFVSWFTYTEVFKIGAVCTWCAISAINMIVIFLLLIKSHAFHI